MVLHFPPLWLTISITVAYLSTPAYFFGRCMTAKAHTPTDLSHLSGIQKNIPQLLRTTVNIKRPLIVFSADLTLRLLFSKVALFGTLLYSVLVQCYQGPSSDALSLGRCWELVGSSVLYNDRLNEVEIDVICGVYKMATGE